MTPPERPEAPNAGFPAIRAEVELRAIRRHFRTWYCEATGAIWTGEVSNHHGIPPGEGYCGGPHRLAEASDVVA